jgi:hypothetical protein
MTVEEAAQVVMRADEAGFVPFRNAYDAWHVDGICLAEYQLAAQHAICDLFGLTWEVDAPFARLVFQRVEKVRRGNVPLGDPEPWTEVPPPCSNLTLAFWRRPPAAGYNGLMAKPKDDPRLAKDACFECGAKLVATSEEFHKTSGKGVRSGYAYRAAEGKGTTHRILTCPRCRKVRGVEGVPK